MAEPEKMNAPSAEDGRMAPLGTKTFLGGRRVSARLRLFAFLAVLAFGGVGGIFYYADKLLKHADQQTAEAADIAYRVVKIEKNIWQLRSTEKDYVQKNDPQHIGVYQGIIKFLNAQLSSLESIKATKSIKEHVATVNDGIAQHAATFKQLNNQKDKNLDRQTKTLGKALNVSAEALKTQLTKANIASLNDSFAHIRQADAQFKASGRTASLSAHKKQIDEFNRLLVSAPISKKDRGNIQRLLKLYQDDMAAFAKIKLTQSAQASRLDEIFTYLLPSLNGITEFVKRQALSAQETAVKSRQLARIAAVAGIAAILILLTIFAIILMQSLAAPVREIAGVADKIIKGEPGTQLPALGNYDEIGEVARALNILKETLAEASQLHQALQTARNTLDKTQQDLQTTHANVRSAEAEAAKSQADAAAAQNALQKARQDLEQEKARKAAPPPEPPADKQPQAEPSQQPSTALTPAPPETSETSETSEASVTSVAPAQTGEPIETIAALSDQLALSSQTASTAALEAERTSTLIRGLNEAEIQLEKIEPLVRLIGKQTNLDSTTENNDGTATLSSDQDARKRFETIRKAAIQVLQTVRTASRTVSQSKGAALEIAASNSASALEITTDLLEQSENLRGMLNNLIGKLHSTSLPAPKAASRTKAIGKTTGKTSGKTSG